MSLRDQMRQVFGGSREIEPDFETWDSATRFLIRALGAEGGGDPRVGRVP